MIISQNKKIYWIFTKMINGIKNYFHSKVKLTKKKYNFLS